MARMHLRAVVDPRGSKVRSRVSSRRSLLGRLAPDCSGSQGRGPLGTLETWRSRSVSGAEASKGRAVKPGWLQRILRIDWDAIAGIAAAFLALVLHWLDLVDANVLLALTMLLVALLFVRDIRRERLDDELQATVRQADGALARIESSLTPADVVLIGPAHIQKESARFSHEARGEMVWFHVCLLMFKPQFLFDVLLAPAIANPHVTAISFILDPVQKALWDEHVLPKTARLAGGEKVRPPVWVPIQENVSIILGEQAEGRVECLLSFWGEPFMSRHAGRDVPRYVFRVQRGSELVLHLSELIRRYRLSSGA